MNIPRRPNLYIARASVGVQYSCETLCAKQQSAYIAYEVRQEDPLNQYILFKSDISVDWKYGATPAKCSGAILELSLGIAW